MKFNALVSAILIGAVAPFARGATATNPNPKTFDTVPTHTETMKTFLAKKSKATSYYPTGMFFKYTTLGNAERLALGEDYKTNGVVRLSWKGTSGESTVTVMRLSDGDKRTLKTTGTSVDFLAPEIGRNYKWTVTNGGTESGPWYFYTDGEAPRIIPQELAKVGNCRDMGGWVTEDGQYRVRQGLGYRNDHNADFYQYADLKPFWTDIAKIRTDMDLRDKAGKTQWYCNWELDSNDSPGRSPYGEHWWNVLYWNVVREGEYGKKMEAYASLVNTRTGDAKKASVNTWKCFADAQNLPIVVHCSQGRDRTGTVAFVLLGALGVGLNDLYADWALTDYAAPSDFPKKSGDEGGSTIVSMYNALKSAYPDSKYPKLQAKCEQLLKDMGMTAAQIANLKSYFLEPVEKKLTAAPGGTSVAVPTLSKTRVSKTGSAQKPTVKANAAYTVDYGGGDYTNYGKYLVTVTLNDPTTTHWSDGTIGPKVLPFVIEHVTNVFIGDAVMSFIKGDTSPHIRIGRPRYLGEVTCNYTEEQLNNLPPGDYVATFTAKTCEMASKVSTTTCKFKVYPATEKATYTYEYADLKSAFFKTDYTPAIQTDKIEVRMMDQTADEGYAPFSCGPYPASLTIMKMSGGYIRYHHGGQRVDLNPPGGTWAINKVYKLTANGKSITHYDEETAKSATKSFSAFDEVNPTPGTAYIGCAIEKTANMGAEGTPGYHQPHRIYHVKAWANGSSLIHEFVPCMTTGGHAMLYDKETKKLYPFSHTLAKTGTVTLGGTATKVEGGDEPVVDPTEQDPTKYGAADTAASTYTWKGGNGPWEHTTNWTASTGATYGIPSHATYATANFPATVTAATACTLTSDRSVKVAKFDSPNLALTLDNAKLTVTDWIDDTRIGAFNFGDTASGNSTLTLSGSKAALVATRGNVRANFGSQKSGTTGSCTVKFVVPATGWESTAPIRETGSDAKVCFWYNVRFDIDARALGVPADGVVKRVLLASSTDGIRFYGDDAATTYGRSTVLCADGATGELMVEGNALVLTVTGGAAPQPEPEPTPSPKFDAAHTIVCYGDSLTWGTYSSPSMHDVKITYDNRPNYFDGRFAGQTEKESYPYLLAGMVPTNYNVMSQAREGMCTDFMLGWSGGIPLRLRNAVTLPKEANSYVDCPCGLIFDSSYAHAPDGTMIKIYPSDDGAKRWAGCGTPILPLLGPFGSGVLTGTVDGQHVRLVSTWNDTMKICRLKEGTGSLTLAQNALFTPDSVNCFPGHIQVIFPGTNDGADNADNYLTALSTGLQNVAKFIVISTHCGNIKKKSEASSVYTNPNAYTAVEQEFANRFGEHYICLRREMMNRGVQIANEELGLGVTGAWNASDGSGLLNGPGKLSDGTTWTDTTHFNPKGYKVLAYIVNEKLRALGYVTGDEPTPVEPVPEPTPTSKFDSDHTIVCYGDSLTYGTSAQKITMDGRPNYFDGRLAGVSGVPESYTYWLSGLLTNTYNVISQSREGSPASHMTAWSGESEVVVDRSFVLPATGSVSIPTNLVFTSDCPWGKWGRWVAYPQKGEERDSIEHWSGFATPIYPLYETYDDEKTHFSITGTLCGRHVRVQGVWPTETTVTVFGTGTAQAVPVGAKFVPDNATLPLYADGIRILCGSGNDGYRGYDSSVVTDKSGKTIDGGFAKYAKPYFDAFAAKGGKYLIVSQCCQTEDPNLGETQYQDTPTDMETKMAAAYGRNYLNLRMAFMTNGVATAQALGVWPAGSTKPWYDPSTLFHDGTHFTSAGYKVMAEFIRRKLVEIGYVTSGDEPTPPPVVMNDYYAKRDTAISTYQSSSLWYKNAARTTKWSAYPNAYDAAVHFAPNAGVEQILVLDDNLNAKAGEVVFEGNVSLRYGTQTFQNNTATPKAVWSVLSGEAGAVCQGIVLTGTGTGYVDVYGGASAAFTTATLSDNLSIRFNPDNCVNAAVRFDSWDGTGVTTYGALTGGAAAATQSVTVENAFAKATSTAVASGVAGKLAIAIKLGDKNTATADAPLAFAGVFKVNAGSTLTVDAGGKPEGTYPLIAAGTLTDSANLAGSATVSGVASGFKAKVEKSGNKINLVIEKIDEPTPPPPGPVDPEEFGTNAMKTAAWGYEIHGLGEKQNEVALVFTNCDASAGMSWEVPDGVTSFEFLVVGGGGGGGAFTAGGGGGGGGVVTGCVHSVSEGDKIEVTVGAGGSGGASNGTKGTVGGDSTLGTYVTAYGGGYGSGKAAGGSGGSGGGASGSTASSWAGGAVKSAVIASENVTAVQYGMKGGANNTATATDGAGGGGAMSEGGRPTSKNPGFGGEGLSCDLSGESQVYGSGGGGGSNNAYVNSKAGAGGKNAGSGVLYKTANQRDAVPNFGGGGGGGGYNSATCRGGNGGSGVVIIRYARAGGEEPVVDPTKYGEADTAAATYAWKGQSGMWNHTTSWTPSTATATYGIPNSAANATAEFPATLTDAFTCTVTNDMSVRFAKFDAPNMTLVIDNASLTCNDRLDMVNWGSFYIGQGLTGDSTVEFKGAKAALVSTKTSTRAHFGCIGGGATGVCAVRFVVPASGWTTTATAPVRTAGDSKIFLNGNVRFDVDATALGVPAEGQTKAVVLMASTDGIIDNTAGLGDIATVACAQGARGGLVLEDFNGSYYKTLKLVVSPDSAPLALALTAPAANATDVAVIRPVQAAFFALDRDARWAQVDDRTARDAMVDASSFPQDVEFAWEGGTAPYAFTMTRTRDGGKAVKTITGLTEPAVSVDNLETGRAYTWTVTDNTGASASRSFTTAYADQRFLRVPAANAYNAVKGFASTKSADVHNGYLPNFRDLGGMFTADGSKRVRQGVAYRSFQFDLAGVSLGVDTDAVVAGLGVKTDLDLRNADEVKNISQSPLGAGVAWVNCQMLPYGVANLIATKDAVANALRVFADASKLPAVFHCSAGQDRTGTLAMLLGAILDLDEEDIEKGWSASCFFQNGMDIVDSSGTVLDQGFQTHRVKAFFGDCAKYGQPGDTFAACVRNMLKAEIGLTDEDFENIRANLLEEDNEETRPEKATVDVPDSNAIAREYDGTAQTTYLRTNPRYTVAMAADAVDPGDYPVTLSLVNAGDCAWSDGTVDDKTVIFTIGGEKPEDDGPTPGYNASTGELTFSNGVLYTYAEDKSYNPSKAIFEPGASVEVENGSEVSIDAVYLQGAGNAFTVDDGGSKITLTPCQATLSAANSSLDFVASYGGAIVVNDVGGAYTGTKWAFSQSGMTLSCTERDNAYFDLHGITFSKGRLVADLADSTLKLNSLAGAGEGSAVTLDNATLKTNYDVQMGSAASTLTLAGEAPQVRSANGPLKLGANLTVRLVPELGWSATEGRFASVPSTTATGAKVTLVSGCRFEVDVSALVGFDGSVTFCLVSAGTSQTTAHAVTLPDADHVTVVGVGAENCAVEFSCPDATKPNVYVTVTVRGSVYPDWIGAGDEANKAKFDAWVLKYGVSDRPGANETAYLLNCDATDEAIETALEAFKIPSIAVTDDAVEVARPVHPEAPAADFNGEVVIRGSATVTGDYELSEDSEDARFFKAFIKYFESK